MDRNVQLQDENVTETKPGRCGRVLDNFAMQVYEIVLLDTLVYIYTCWFQPVPSWVIVWLAQSVRSMHSRPDSSCTTVTKGPILCSRHLNLLSDSISMQFQKRCMVNQCPLDSQRITHSSCTFLESSQILVAWLLSWYMVVNDNCPKLIWLATRPSVTSMAILRLACTGN